MLPLRRFGYVLLIVAVISVFFLMYDLMDDNDKHLAELSNPVGVSVELLEGKADGQAKEVRFFLIGSEKKEFYGELYKNVRQGLEEAKLPFRAAEQLKLSEVPQDAVLIFCDDSIGVHVDLKDLVTFITEGGRAVFAAGIAEGYEDSYLQPLFGLVEKSTKANYMTYSVEKQFLPLQASELAYDGFSASTWITIRDNAEVYLKDTDTGVPILYEMPYGSGKILMLNSTFLNDYRTMGIFLAALGTFDGDLMYPVLGTKSVFLDNYPAVTGLTDKMSMHAYGRTLETMFRDSVWPLFEGIAVRRDLNYSIGILAASSESAFPELDESMYSIVSKSIRRYGGELVYGIIAGSGELNPNTRFLDSFSRYFQNYEIRGAVITGELPPDDRLRDETQRLFGKSVLAFRSSQLKSGEASFWMDGEAYRIPVLSETQDLKQGGLFTAISGLSLYGMISHVFDLNTLLFEGEVPVFDKKKKEISAFEDQLLKQTEYLETRTLSNLKDVVESYLKVDYRWSTSGNITRIYCDQFRAGQPFYYWTEKTPEKTKGLSMVSVKDGLYLLKILEPEAEITWK